MAWSVIVAGQAREVTRMHEGLDVTELGVTPWQAGSKPTFIRIVPTAITGRMFRAHRPGRLTHDRVQRPWYLSDRIGFAGRMSTADTVDLTEHECWSLLEGHVVARLAVDIGGRPDIFPINYVVDDRSIVFRSGAGTKLAGAVLSTTRGDRDRRARTWTARSGVSWSRASRTRSRTWTERFEVEDLPLYPWIASDKPNFVRIEPELTTGRRFHVDRTGRAEGAGVHTEHRPEHHPGAPSTATGLTFWPPTHRPHGQRR